MRCKPSTAAHCRLLLRKHVLPTLGSLPLSAVSREDAADLHHKLRATPAAANAAVTTLSRMFRFAETCGLAPESGNPCRFVIKYRERKRERFLADDEFDRLSAVLTEMEADGRLSPHAAAALRLLMMTGCRRNEILTLRRTDVDLNAGELRLADAKTGARTVALSPQAVKVLTKLPRVSDNPWVIAGPRPGKRLSNINEHWGRVRTRARLEDVRLHDLRHSWASRTLALGESLPMIGRLLGHSQVETTARYAHLARDSVHEAASRIAASIAGDLLCDRAGYGAEGPSLHNTGRQSVY